MAEEEAGRWGFGTKAAIDRTKRVVDKSSGAKRRGRSIMVGEIMLPWRISSSPCRSRKRARGNYYLGRLRTWH